LAGVEKLPQATAEAIQPNDADAVAWPRVGQQRREARPVEVATADDILEQPHGSGCIQTLTLGL
jgi:hypothetical protein